MSNQTIAQFRLFTILKFKFFEKFTKNCKILSTNNEFICKKSPGNYKRQTLEVVVIGTWTQTKEKERYLKQCKELLKSMTSLMLEKKPDWKKKQFKVIEETSMGLRMMSNSKSYLKVVHLLILNWFYHFLAS